MFQQVQEILAVSVFHKRPGKFFHFLGAYIAHAIGYFLKARYLQALPLLNGFYVVGCLHKGLMGSGVKPGDTAT